MIKGLIAPIAGCAFLLITGAAHAGDYILTLKDQKFAPQELTVPAGQKIRLTVKNLNSTPAEFESYDLNREKIIKAGDEVVVNIGPLAPGTYKIFDDFHEETTGVIKAQ